MFSRFRLPGHLLLILVGVLFSSWLPAAANASPSVVVSIAPLHSLVSAVMQGVAEPILLVPPGQSPHSYQLRPSEMRRLSEAELVVWVGPEFEISLRKPVELLRSGRRIELLDTADMQLLKARRTGIWEHGHEHEHDEEAEHGAEDHLELVDPHLWLSSVNAEVIAVTVMQALVELDPVNEMTYRENLMSLQGNIERARVELGVAMAPLGGLSYLVFHDAYHYFEHEFGLNPVGAVTLSPERKPGAKTVLAIKRALEERGARCIFHEPQFEPRLVQRIAEETGLWVGVLDPVGAELGPGPELWFELMYALRDSLQECADHSS